MELIIGAVFTYLLVSCVIGYLIAESAENRKISKTTVFLVSVLLSPIIAMFLVVVADKKEK